MQTVSTAYFWRLVQQVLSSQALASHIAAPDVELFTIRPDIVKATSMDIKYIITITSSLSFARKAVDSSMHSEQAHFLAVYYEVISLIKLDKCSKS